MGNNSHRYVPWLLQPLKLVAWPQLLSAVHRRMTNHIAGDRLKHQDDHSVLHGLQDTVHNCQHETAAKTNT